MENTLIHDTMVVGGVALIIAEDAPELKLSERALKRVRSMANRIIKQLKSVRISSIKPYHILALVVLGIIFRIEVSVNPSGKLLPSPFKHLGRMLNALVATPGEQFHAGAAVGTWTGVLSTLVMFSAVAARVKYLYKHGKATKEQYEKAMTLLNTLGASITLYAFMLTPGKVRKDIYKDLVNVAKLMKDTGLVTFLKQTKSAQSINKVFSYAAKLKGADKVVNMYKSAIDKAKGLASRLVNIFKKNPEKAAEQLNKAVK